MATGKIAKLPRTLGLIGIGLPVLLFAFLWVWRISRREAPDAVETYVQIAIGDLSRAGRFDLPRKVRIERADRDADLPWDLRLLSALSRDDNRAITTGIGLPNAWERILIMESLNEERQMQITIHAFKNRTYQVSIVDKSARMSPADVSQLAQTISRLASSVLKVAVHPALDDLPPQS